MEDFHEAERVAELPRQLSTAAPESADPKVGDLAFFASRGNLAVYYGDASPASGVVILGHLAEVLATAGQVTIELTP